MPGPFHPLHFPIVFWGVALESTVCLSPCSQPHPPGSSLTDNYAPLPPAPEVEAFHPCLTYSSYTHPITQLYTDCTPHYT